MLYTKWQILGTVQIPQRTKLSDTFFKVFIEIESYHFPPIFPLFQLCFELLFVAQLLSWHLLFLWLLLHPYLYVLCMYVYAQLYVNATCRIHFSSLHVHNFNADHPILDNQWGTDYWQRLILLLPTVISCLYSSFSKGGSPWNFAPSMLTCPLMLPLFWFYLCRCFRRDCFKAEFLVFWLFPCPLLSPSMMLPET